MRTSTLVHQLFYFSSINHLWTPLELVNKEIAIFVLHEFISTNTSTLYAFNNICKGASIKTYTLAYLTRNNYLDSLETLKEDKALKFANMSLDWWDKQFGWYIKGCVVLTDESGFHLSYIFYKIDKHNDYITIHNIFTPYSKRRLGYAQKLLSMIFEMALVQQVKRFRFTSISNSLNFYLKLGIVYWGVNSVGDFYCDLPMPKEGLEGIKEMIILLTIGELIGNKYETINQKIKNNSLNLTIKQRVSYDADLLKLHSSYLHNDFLAIRKSKEKF